MCKCYLLGSTNNEIECCTYHLRIKNCICSCNCPLGFCDDCCPHDNHNPYCSCCLSSDKTITYIEGDTDNAVLNYYIKQYKLREQHTIFDVYCCCFKDEVISTNYKTYYKTQQDAIDIINMLKPPHAQAMVEEGEN